MSKQMMIKVFKEFLRAGLAAALAALGFSVVGCATVPFFIF